MELLKEIETKKAHLELLRITRENTIKDFVIELKDIISSCSTFPIKEGWISFEGSSFDFAFDRGDKNNFGLDFHIYIKGDLLELSHSFGLSGERDYLLEVRPYLIERDKLIAKLWDKEKEIIDLYFKYQKKDIFSFYDITFRELEQLESEQRIKENQERKDRLLGEAKSYKYFKIYNTYYGIIKICDKIVKYGKVQKITSKKEYYVSDYCGVRREDLNDFLRNIENGTYKLTNEIVDSEWDYWRQSYSY